MYAHNNPIMYIHTYFVSFSLRNNQNEEIGSFSPNTITKMEILGRQITRISTSSYKACRQKELLFTIKR